MDKNIDWNAVIKICDMYGELRGIQKITAKIKKMNIDPNPTEENSLAILLNEAEKGLEIQKNNIKLIAEIETAAEINNLMNDYNKYDILTDEIENIFDSLYDENLSEEYGFDDEEEFDEELLSKIKTLIYEHQQKVVDKLKKINNITF